MSYLSHHGIKGQQWGHRNGPPYPIDHSVMKKGTVRANINSANLGEINNVKKRLALAKQRNNLLYTYDPNDEHDKEIYEGPFAAYSTMRYPSRWIVSDTYETTKDLKLATLQERKETFKDVYNKNKKVAVSELSSIQSRVQQMYEGNAANNNNNKEEQNEWLNKANSIQQLNLNDIKTEQDWDSAYDIFNHKMESAHASKLCKTYIKDISKRYDGMVDDNNVNKYNEAHDPVIIFNPSKNLKYKRTKIITDDIIDENYNKVKKRRGGKVLL